MSWQARQEQFVLMLIDLSRVSVCRLSVGVIFTISPLNFTHTPEQSLFFILFQTMFSTILWLKMDC